VDEDPNAASYFRQPPAPGPKDHGVAVSRWKGQAANAPAKSKNAEPAQSGRARPTDKIGARPGEKKVWDHIPFGKYSIHNGYMLVDVPTWYLKWFLDNVENRGTGLHDSVEAELWKRSDRD